MRPTGGNSVPASLSDGRMAGPQHQREFAGDTAAAAGMTKRAINEHLARAEALGEDLDEIAGTSLDKGVELDALKDLPQEERKELIQRAKAIKRRKEIWEAMRPDAQRAAHSESGTSCSTLGGRGNTEFAAETAKASGQSKQDINRHLARAEALGEDLDEIAGTSLDKGVELDALKDLPQEERKELIQRAKAIKRRKEIWEAMRPTFGTTCSETPVKIGRPVDFAGDTAKASGQSKQDINRHLARAEALGEDLDEIAGNRPFPRDRCRDDDTRRHAPTLTAHGATAAPAHWHPSTTEGAGWTKQATGRHSSEAPRLRSAPMSSAPNCSHSGR